VARARPPIIRPRTEKIKAIMEALNWSESELARRMGTHQSGVTRLLNKRQGLGAPMIAGLVMAFRDVFGDHIGFDQLFEVVDAHDGVETD
jgi:transcriptional regulator with XRE-family HTH domain